MDALVPLIAEIMGTYGINPRNVVGHSDVAPARKQDPGELFDWEQLAKLGLAIPRPTKNPVDPGWSDAAFLLALERYGYGVADGPAAVVAFQRRFRPENVDGIIDGQCRAILWSLLLEYEGGPAIA
jgi:N-acetylmuramoyl-L-alanine amidase